MNLYPQNLRDRQHAEIVKRRSYGLTGNSTPESYGDFRSVPEPKVGKLGRLWARRSGLTDKQAATGLPAASMSTLGVVYAPASVVGTFGALITLIAFKKGELDPATTLAVSSALTAAF